MCYTDGIDFCRRTDYAFLCWEAQPLDSGYIIQYANKGRHSRLYLIKFPGQYSPANGSNTLHSNAFGASGVNIVAALYTELIKYDVYFPPVLVVRTNLLSANQLVV